MSDHPYLVIMTTAPGEDLAGKIAAALVEQKLAACVQASHITSTYRWQSKIAMDQEVRLMIKAPAAHYEAIEKLIRSLHSYETPEILAIPVVAGSQSYLDWLDAETQA